MNAFQWVGDLFAWFSTLSVGFVFLLSLPIVVAVAGWVRVKLDRLNESRANDGQR